MPGVVTDSPRFCDGAMKNSDVVIIGGVACGPKTAATLARRMPEASITLYQREKLLSYGTCGMPYFASGDVDSFRDLTTTSYGVVRDVDFFKNSKGFDAVPGHDVVAIDRENKKLTVKNLETGETFEHGYDRLVLATGATPKQLPFDVPESDRIRHFTRPEDAINFRKQAQTGQIGTAAVIGAGFIGLEVAEAAGGLWGIEVTVIEQEPQVLPYALDPEMSKQVEAELIRQDVTLKTGTRVESIELVDDLPKLTLSDGSELTVDYVFLCLGVKPQSELAKQCGLEVGELGGILVDDHMRTSDESIYAGGDCVETENPLTGKRCYVPLGSLANRHGRVIAEKIAGNEMTYPGTLGSFFIKVFDINVGSVGISESAARREGVPIQSIWGTFPDKPDFYPESHTMVLKMIYRPTDMRLLGIQAVGTGDVCRRVDVFSAMLNFEGTVDDLMNFEHGYAPPFSEAVDPLHHLAALAQAQMRGDQFLSPNCDFSDFDEEVQLLDVREADEVESEPSVGVYTGKNGLRFHQIALNSLSSKTGELDRNRPLLVICKRGPRSYQAMQILKREGFAQVYVLTCGVTAFLSARVPSDQKDS